MIHILTENGEVRDDIKEILDVVARTGMTLASGHLHVSETWKVFEEAKRRGITRMMLTHPEDFIEASLNDVAGLAAMGMYAKHSMNMFVEGSKFHRFNHEDLKRQIEAAGVDKTILCSDCGQIGGLHVVECFRRAIKMCIDLGYSDPDIRKMVSTNVAHVLGIEADLPQAA